MGQGGSRLKARFLTATQKEHGEIVNSVVPWWQAGIIYQIYPRSFQDSDGDGVGDLQGIIDRLDYLVWLGVDALWISPICQSPMADFGYDVADYQAIDPVFGDLRDFDRLVGEAHRRGLKLILDFVPNHTSDHHPWFLESRASRQNPRRDWYIWRAPKTDGSSPNNWLSHFGGSAWEWDGVTGQYYYHSFLRAQPDLNWRNPEVRRAMYEVLRFWLDRGVDGFRVDVLWLLVKDDQFRDNPVNPAYRPGEPAQHRLLPLYTADRPEVHEIVAEMRRVLDSYDDRVLIGEIYLPIERLVTYYGHGLLGAHLPFNFQLLSAAWTAPEIARIISEYENALPAGAWPNWVLGNHDNPRLASRIGDRQARVAAMLLLTLRGTPTVYYGEEIGMTDVPIAPGDVRDPRERQQPGLGLGRDPERTPMRWDGSASAGFTHGTPWLPIGQSEEGHHVAAMSRDPTSLLMLYRGLIDLRRNRPALSIGKLSALEALGNALIYQRSHESDRIAVLLNLGHEPCSVPGPRPSTEARVLLSTRLDTRRPDEPIGREIMLGPDEGLVLELAPGAENDEQERDGPWIEDPPSPLPAPTR
jgi:alpha-glucosidase